MVRRASPANSMPQRPRARGTEAMTPTAPCAEGGEVCGGEDERMLLSLVTRSLSL